MTGRAADIGDDAPDLADPRGEGGGCGPGDKNGVGFERWGGGLQPDRLLQQNPPGHHTPGGTFATVKEHGMAGILQGGLFVCLVLLHQHQ